MEQRLNGTLLPSEEEESSDSPVLNNMKKLLTSQSMLGKFRAAGESLVMAAQLDKCVCTPTRPRIAEGEP